MCQTIRDMRLMWYPRETLRVFSLSLDTSLNQRGSPILVISTAGKNVILLYKPLVILMRSILCEGG